MNIEVKIPSPLTQMFLSGREVYVKREDLIHPYISGNKFRKLKYNLLHGQHKNIKQIISFGGAYSNHLHALAFVCQFYSVDLIVFMRGEPISNPTIDFIRASGAEIRFVGREEFRSLKLQTFFPDWPDALVIPEGGSNPSALEGIREMMDEIQIPASQYCVSYGSGATSIGMMSSLKTDETLHVFSALKFPSFEREFRNRCLDFKLEPCGVVLHGEYHFGGYAKWNMELIDFMNRTELALDPIYTGKLFYGVAELINSGGFDPDRPIVLIHSGGLQGVSGFNQRFGNLLNA